MSLFNGEQIIPAVSSGFVLLSVQFQLHWGGTSSVKPTVELPFVNHKLLQYFL